MKCVCGYEHESGLDENSKWNGFLKGDEKFIPLTGSTFMECEGHGQYREVHLYACPKCNTVRMDRW